MLALTSAVCASILSSSILVSGETYFSETFDDESWTDRWHPSNIESGKWLHTPGNWFSDEEDLAIKTGDDARFYALTAKLATPVNNEGKDLVIQYLVKNEQNIDCGGAYVKLLGADIDPASFGGETPYAVMFGPDICGATKKTHAILNYARPKGEDTAAKNMDHLTPISAPSDVHAHLYTFVIAKDNTYIVKVDNEVVKEGTLASGWPFQPPQKIPDPALSKPSSWVDVAVIPDPEDTKPDGYDDIPAEIPDPEASKPDDWDEEDDGEWEAPLIDNPEYQGEWEPKMIPNPDYQGEWVHPEIENPDYFEDDMMYHRCNPCEYIGMELWQVKSGTVFDDFLVTDSVDEAEAAAVKVMEKIKALKTVKEALDEEEQAKKDAEMADEDPAMTDADFDGDDFVAEKEEDEEEDLDAAKEEL